MNADHDPSRESLWRGPRPSAEVNAAAPDVRLEARLTAALGRLPEVPVSSNFTARVLAAVDREEAVANRPQSGSMFWLWLRSAWWPRVAAAATVLVVASLAFRQQSERSAQAQLAQTVATVALNQPAPSVEALENLDAIQRLGQSGHADGELLSMLQ
jgi:negative regulator of sigma E activity